MGGWHKGEKLKLVWKHCGCLPYDNSGDKAFETTFKDIRKILELQALDICLLERTLAKLGSVGANGRPQPNVVLNMIC